MGQHPLPTRPHRIAPTEKAGPGPMISHWLRVDRTTFLRILLLAMGVGLLSLGVPVAAQGVIGALTASAMLPPVFVLSTVLLICLGYLGLLHMLEIRAVEWLARNIFLRVAHDLGFACWDIRRPRPTATSGTTGSSRWCRLRKAPRPC